MVTAAVDEKASREAGPASLDPIATIPAGRLRDRTARGRTRPWRKWRSKADVLAQAFANLGDFKTAAKVGQCGNELRFWVCPNDGAHKLVRARFCHVRLCPMCAWRRSQVTSAAARLAFGRLSQRRPVRYIFVTLTVPNVPADSLGSAVDGMLLAWERMTKTRWFGIRVPSGYLRSLEVTVNRKDHTYHPHIHAVLAVEDGPDGYFDGPRTGPLYATQAEWQERWEAATGLTLAIVDVRAVKGAAGAAAEVAKYEVKPSSVLVASDPKGTAEAVRVISEALRGRRMVEWGGELRKIHRELVAEGKAQDAESDDADLVHVDSDEPEGRVCPRCGAMMIAATYRWDRSVADYVYVPNEAGP
ncbi:MAG: protein rep [Candidatus Parvarchaeota archaeon]